MNISFWNLDFFPVNNFSYDNYNFSNPNYNFTPIFSSMDYTPSWLSMNFEPFKINSFFDNMGTNYSFSFTQPNINELPFNIFSSKSNKSSKSSTIKTKPFSLLTDNTKNAVSSMTWNSFKSKNGVKTINIAGSNVYACRWSSFEHSQKEWLDMQKYMIKAAEDLDLTLVYSDMDRSKSTSDIARAKKGSIVAPGGSSPHNYGAAVDICLFSNGKQVSTSSDLFKKYANLVKELSNNQIVWGGDWSKPDEEHHFELRGWREKYKKQEYLIA